MLIAKLFLVRTQDEKQVVGQAVSVTDAMEKEKRMEVRKEYYSPLEVRKILGVRQQTIYMMLESKLIPAFKIGNRWKIPIDLFDEWRAEMAKGGNVIEEV